MAKQKTIGLTLAEYAVLGNAKKAFELLTGCKISWGAYLVATSSGALATYAIKGLELSCSQCGERALIRYITPKENSLVNDLDVSTGQNGRRKY